MRCWVTDDFKLVLNLFTSDELYDRRNDPNEMHNLIDDIRFADDRSKMHDALLDYKMCIRDRVVKGAHADEQKERTYLYQGIAERNFERKFQLAENIHVRGANLVNGLLYIDLERVIPEAKKPRRIEIN